jgi:predicted nucleotidyltransferase
MKNQELKVRHTTINFKDLKIALEGCSEVSAAYLFGSAASGEAVVNDLDILVLLHQEIDKDEAYINLIYTLSKSLKIPEACVDLLFFDSYEADPSILTRAVNRGIREMVKAMQLIPDNIDIQLLLAGSFSPDSLKEEIQSMHG